MQTGSRRFSSLDLTTLLNDFHRKSIFLDLLAKDVSAKNNSPSVANSIGGSSNQISSVFPTAFTSKLADAKMPASTVFGGSAASDQDSNGLINGASPSPNRLRSTNSVSLFAHESLREESPKVSSGPN
jgi:hypothetical protein